MVNVSAKMTLSVPFNVGSTAERVNNALEDARWDGAVPNEDVEERQGTVDVDVVRGVDAERAHEHDDSDHVGLFEHGKVEFDNIQLRGEGQNC